LWELAHQLDVKAPTKSSVTRSKGIAFKGAGFTSQESVEYETPVSALVEAVVDGLRDRSLLHVFRPERANDFVDRAVDHYYVYETLTATPVLLPLKSINGSIPAADAINIWVGDPQDDVKTPAAHEWDWVGSFLFVVEEMQALEGPDRRHFVSGLSALRMLVQSAMGGEIPPRDEWYAAQGGDDFGRWNPAHPIEKLEAIGGRPGRTREIETVYQIVYMTNEQSYTRDGEEIRSNDIFAYPLYIAE
jgi:hypothetical protein